MVSIDQTLENKIANLKYDILNVHLVNVKKSLETGYVDENQALVVYDHMVRLKIYVELLEDIRNGKLNRQW